MKTILSALAITALCSACAPSASVSGRDSAAVPADAHSCGSQHPCPAQAASSDALGRQNYWRSPDGREETWSSGGNQYMRFDGQLSVMEPARESSECLLMLVDPKHDKAAQEQVYNQCWYRHNPDINPATNKLWWATPPATPSFGGSALLDSIQHDIDTTDQRYRMEDMKRDMQRQIDELKDERDREHLRYLDSESTSQ
jgi:hypothetical protein